MRVVSREKGWVQVADNDGKTGWVYEGLIAPSDVPESQKAAEAQAAPNQQQEPGERVKVAASGAAMRAGPSQSAATLFGLPYGRELRVLARQSGWVQVMDLGSKQTGWVEQSALAAAGEQQGQAADNSQQSENPQSQGAASNAPQRSSRDATLPPEHGNANGSPRQAWLPPEEVGPQHEMEEPRDRSRQWGKRHGRFGGFLRRAFGGL
jgi:SH3-like domain-containing protein